MTQLSNWILPLVLMLIPLYGFGKGIPIYDSFLEGAREGIHTVGRVLPTLVGMLFAIGNFIASGAMDALTGLLGPILSAVGIPPELRERVFERFYRVDQSHSGNGTGLGLSIVKHGAAYLGAQVTLESEMGKGSVFTVLFPRDTINPSTTA